MQFIEPEAKESNTERTKYVTKDRQWDCRFNSPSEESDDAIVQLAKAACDASRLRYVLIGGPEVGNNPKQDDYGCRHVHVAVVSHNPLARSTILSIFGIKRGFYCVSRNRALPISGWRDHHIKELTKCDPTKRILYEFGELPENTKKAWTLRSDEEEKRKIDEVLIDIRDMLKKGKTEDEIFERFPRNWMMYGEKVKSMLVQRVDFFKTNGNPHIWLYGNAGAGKSSLISYIYPKAYKKNLYNRFFDLYKPLEHTHVILEDLDHAAVECLGLNFIKTLCDESGFNYDQKYEAPQPARTTVLITSQFDIANILGGLDKQIEIGQQGSALRRRFMEISAKELHRVLGIKLRSTYELRQLKQEGNTDPTKCFLGWNYLENMPSLKEIPSPEECQKLIRDHYYGH